MKIMLPFNFSCQGELMLQVSASYHHCNLRNRKVVSFPLQSDLSRLLLTFALVNQFPLKHSKNKFRPDNSFCACANDSF